jgi:hypothetical protein
MSHPNCFNVILEWKHASIIGKKISSFSRIFSEDIELFIGKVTFGTPCRGNTILLALRIKFLVGDTYLVRVQVAAIVKAIEARLLK